jgi:hypothetical protein
MQHVPNTYSPLPDTTVFNFIRPGFILYRGFKIGYNFIRASARSSNGQGYQGFLRKRAGSSFGSKRQFASYKEKLEKQTELHSF